MFVSQIIDEVLDILGTTDKPKAFRKLTQAVQVLMQSGHYFHANAEVDVCSGWDGQTITLPRGIEVPLAVNVDGSPMYFRGRLFQYSVNKGGMYSPVGWAWDDRGMVATQMDIRQPSQLVAVAEHEADAGKVIRVIGTDGNNRELRAQLGDGTTVDGLLVTVRAQGDFPYGTIQPDGVTITTRSVAVDPITTLLSSSPHQLSSGQSVQLTATGTIPAGLEDKQKYYTGVVSNTEVELYDNELDAQYGTNPYKMSSIVGSTGINLTDSRPTQLSTVIQLKDGVPPVPIDSPNEVTFENKTNKLTLTVTDTGAINSSINSIVINLEGGASSPNLLLYSVTVQDGDTLGDIAANIAGSINNNTSNTGYSSSFPFTGSAIQIQAVNSQNAFLSASFGLGGATPRPTFSQQVVSGGLLPSPLVKGSTYFAQQVESGSNSIVNLQVYASLRDAYNKTNPIYLYGSTSDITTYIRKPFVPQTKLVFTSDPNYVSGDIVKANTAGGTLPQPLISGQDYYVHVLAGETLPAVTLHTNYSESLTGDNPIALTTAGSGQNSIAKFLTATASPGTKNNISVSGLTLPSATGSGAVVTARVSGPLTSMTLVTGGAGYTTATATISDVGGYKYASAPSISLVGGTYTTTASLQAVLGTDAATGFNYVASIQINSGGSGYTVANLPKVVFIGGLASGGFHAKASLVLDGSGTITGVTLLPNGSDAAASLSVNSITGAVNGINITSSGQGYLYPPRVTISAPQQAKPQLTIVSPGVQSATITALTVNGLATNLLSGTYTNGAAPSVSTVAAGLAPLITNGGYSAAVSPTANDTIVITPPTGVTITSISVTTGGSTPAITFSSSLPKTATASSTITTSFVSEYVIENGGSGYQNVPAVNISGGGGTGASATAVLDQYGIGKINVLTQGSGYSSSLTALITDGSGGTGTGATALVTVSAGKITAITVTNQGYGYSNPQISFSPAGGGGATFSFEYTGVVTNVNVVTEGTGYTTAPTVSVLPSTGVFIQFSSTGTLPVPLVQGQSYRAENPSSGSSFTVKNADFTDVNITSSGSGNLYLVISRTFAIGFTNYWNGDFRGIGTLPIRLQSDYEFPITSPTADLSATYYLQAITETSAQVYTSSALTTLLQVKELGVGQAYYAYGARSSAIVANNEIIPSYLTYLSSGMKVKFSSTTGVLPAPLSSSTTYLLSVTNGRVSITLQNGTPIVFTGLGQGYLSLDISRNFTVEPSTAVVADNSILSTGDQVLVRADQDDTLPVPLSDSLTYYARAIGNNFVELYDTKAHATATSSTVGRVSFLSTGDTIESVFYIDSILDPILVKSVQHIAKPMTIGYVSLYAFDYGRSNDMALIGQYHPSETNPKYRRIRIGQQAAWVRLIYRVKCPEITSVYDYIPLENARAIIAGVHAVDLEDKDFLDQAQKYWQASVMYLRSENDSMDGHAMQPPQINNITYGDGTDCVMF